MTSFLQTMFVPSSPVSQCAAPKPPLPALHSHVLATCELSPTSVSSPPPVSSGPAGTSPVQQYLRYVLGKPEMAGEESRPRDPPYIPPFHRPLVVKEIADNMKTDLLSRSNSNVRNRNQTSFQPQKRAKGTSSWQLKQFAEATLGSGSLRKVVQLPEGEDRDEWLAVNGTNHPIRSARRLL